MSFQSGNEVLLFEEIDREVYLCEYYENILPGQFNLKLPKFIFIDIDGVLNTRNYLKQQKRETGRMSIKNWCPVACNNLKRVCKKYVAKLVVTSSWRHEYTQDELRELFSSNGINGELIIDTTPSYVEVSDGHKYCRGHEIQFWLENNVTENYRYVIIDDEDIMLPDQLESFVMVSDQDGFADVMALNRCIEILAI